MFEDEEWLAIIDKLMQLTSSRKIIWELEDGTELVTIAGSTRYRITSADNDGAAPFVLTVGRMTKDSWDFIEVDRLSSAGGNAEPWKRTPRAELLKLRNLAYRMALGGPDLARSLLDELKRLDPTTPTPPITSEDPF